ncbi:DUF2793 domain-containing protein [Defluviimonas sp. WL0024]|uniref:DUF2793 domain-containing protein n=1 Tax=Albidovulum salinarum TaxID=2984153 RepID=A0ABT2X435_9RHOB|nr:DUF2793 domain-containing protein [Defluviimonas sp. WL0024]MCU9848706.1 DUF2793 domain-containing protein [Defluviimonas sp. WL0024]
MFNTNQLGLPLLQPAQAQKHVTMNEALTRLDGLVSLTLVSRSVTIPPAIVVDGACYGVPVGAVNEWSGQDGNVAIGTNGGWEFAEPRRGWRTVILDEGAQALHDGSGWRAGMMTLSPSNAGLSFAVAETDHVITAGSVSTTSAIIPPNSVVVGATARVIAAVTGSLTSWSLGNPGAAGRYGSGLSLSVGSWARGGLGQPTAFYAPEVMQLDAAGGTFSGGKVRIAVHYMEIAVPNL